MAERNATAEDAGVSLGRSPDRGQKSQACRFLTKSQFLENVKLKKRRKPTKGARSIARVTAPRASKSTALRGLSFVVLDGRYQARDNSLEAELGREQGWWSDAQKVRSKDSVEHYIACHGGTTMISVSIADEASTAARPTMFVLGGSRNDPKVVAHVTAIEKAIQNSISVKRTASGRTKKAARYATMAKENGVLCWTYVFSLINQWERFSDTAPATDASILDCHPELLAPSKLDYLVLAAGSKVPMGDLQSTTMLRRALELVSANRSTASMKPALENRSWQAIALSQLPPDHRWIVAGEAQVLWPWQRQIRRSDLTDRAVLEGTATEHPILADAMYLYSFEWDDVHLAAHLMMASNMGAIIVDELCSEVTHIVVRDLTSLQEKRRLKSENPDCAEITEDDAAWWSVNDSSDRRRAYWKTLIDTLWSYQEDDTKVIRLITSNWIRKKWNQSK
jgi:hypothetical protein